MTEQIITKITLNPQNTDKDLADGCVKQELQIEIRDAEKACEALIKELKESGVKTVGIVMFSTDEKFAVSTKRRIS